MDAGQHTVHIDTSAVGARKVVAHLDRAAVIAQKLEKLTAGCDMFP
jgi:hypothetical protein